MTLQQESAPVLQIEDLRTYFFTDKGAVPAVDGIDIHIHEKEVLALVGESGCGKSVTSLSIMRLVPNPPGRIVSGRILFKGKDLTSIRESEMRQIRGNKISMIFQEPMTSLNPVFTIGDQLMEVIRLHLKYDKKRARQYAAEMLEKVGIPRADRILDEYPHQLSGGMRQRVMIAMAMACNPSLLIADEPTTALDVTIQAQILDLMRKLNQEYHTSILLITHDLGVVAEMADRVVVMYAGKVVEEADVRTIFKDPKHPYTIGLIQSVPKIDVKEKRLYCIPGNVPAPGEKPQGCSFAPRCQHAEAICHEKMPELLPLSAGHKVRCWLHQPKGEGK